MLILGQAGLVVQVEPVNQALIMACLSSKMKEPIWERFAALDVFQEAKRRVKSGNAATLRCK